MIAMTARVIFKFQEVVMIIGLFLIVFVIGADSFIISPLLPIISHDFNTSIGQTALAVTIYAVCYAVGSPFFGPLGDKYNKKYLLIIGMIVFLVGSFLCAIANDIMLFYIFRAIAGLGAALTMPNVWATIGNYFADKKLNLVMGITMSALSLSIAIGVPLGTILSQLTNWHMAFWSSGGLALVAFLILLMVVPNTYPDKTASLKYFDSFKILFTTKKAVPVLLINLIWMFGFYMFYTFLGTFLAQTFHLNTAQTGKAFIAYGLSNFIASFFGGYLLSKIGAIKSVIIHGLGSVLSLVGLAIFSGKLTMIIFLLVLLALAQGLGVTALTTYIVNIIPKNRSTVMSFNSSFLYLGLTLGSSFGAIFYNEIGFVGITICAAIALVAAVIMAYKLNQSAI